MESRPIVQTRWLHAGPARIAAVNRPAVIREDVHQSHPTMARGSRLLAWGVPALMGVGFVALMYQPTTASLERTLPWNLGDPALNTWILGWESHALIQDVGHFFDGNIFHPYGDATKYSELILPVVPLFGLLSLLTASPIVAHNVVLLCLAVLCVVSTYLLARRLTGPLEAGVAAVSFSFSGYVFMHQGHLQLLTLGFFPLAFLALFRALESRRARDGLWLGISTALVTTGSFYYGAIWMVILITVVLVDLIKLRKPDRQWWGAVAVAAGVTAVLVGPIAYVYAAFQNAVPFTREVGGLGLNPIDFLTPAPGTLVYEGLLEWAVSRQPTGIVEHGFFLGVVVTALAVVGGILFVRTLVGRKRESSAGRARYEMGLLAIGGFISLLIAVGPEVMGVPMPFRLLSEVVPGFDDIRAASRLAVPGLLAVAIFAAWGLQRLLGRIGSEQRLVIVGLIASAVLLEMWVEPTRVEVEAPEPVRQVLASSPPGAVIELPMRGVADHEFAFTEGPRLLASIGDWRPRFNGFSGGFPPGYLEALAVMLSFPEPDSLERMTELDIRYVLLHGAERASPDTYTFSQIGDILEDLPASSSVIGVGDAWLVDLTPDR